MDLIQGLCRERNAALLCVSHDPAMRSRFEKRVSLHELGGGAVAVAGGGSR
jgi:ABC-type lipoprotein export system ATPase subunit